MATNVTLKNFTLDSCFTKEVKHDVYGKRQTRNFCPLFSGVYSRVKLFVFAMNSKRRYSIFVCFIYGLEEKKSKWEVVFAVCRLPLTSCLTSLIKTEWTAEKCVDKRVQSKQTPKHMLAATEQTNKWSKVQEDARCPSGKSSLSSNSNNAKGNID